MEAERHSAVHEVYLGGKADQGRNPVAVQAISGGRSLFLMALAWHVGAVHDGMNNNRKNREGRQLLRVVRR